MQDARFERILSILTEAIDEIVRIKRELREEARQLAERGEAPEFYHVNPDVPTPRREREGER